MPKNDFSKQEVVSFENLCLAFEDNLILSKMVSIFDNEGKMMERAGDTVWRPMPYIMVSQTGTDMTGKFSGNTQRSVPATLGFDISVPFSITPKEMRDPQQRERLMKSAAERLASDINVAVMTAAIQQGTIVLTKATAAADYDDPANVETALNRVGISKVDRKIGYSSGDYQKLAKDLAGRQTIVAKTANAYEKSLVGPIAGFDLHRLDYSLNVVAAAGGAGLTMDTRASATNYWVPAARSKAASGEGANVDNRRQRVTISSTTSVRAGDCFTIATVDEVHHITKGDTGSLKTFRVISVDSATTMTISPPIVSAQGGAQSEIAYQNCVVNTPASNSAIVFLNTTTKPANPFWVPDAIELLPGKEEIEPDAGWVAMSATTENKIPIQMLRQANIDTKEIKHRLDAFFGVCVKQPEMCGIQLFNQT